MLLIAVHLPSGKGGEKVISLYIGVGMEITSFRAVNVLSFAKGELVVTCTWSPWSDTVFAGDERRIELGGRSFAMLMATDCVPGLVSFSFF